MKNVNSHTAVAKQTSRTQGTAQENQYLKDRLISPGVQQGRRQVGGGFQLISLVRYVQQVNNWTCYLISNSQSL